MLNKKRNKKGGITIFMIIAIALIVSLVIVLGIVAFVTNKINEGLDQDVMIGQSNLSEITQETLGVTNTALANNLDLFGLFLIFGMIGGLFIASFVMRGRFNKLLIIVDILLIISAFFIAIPISNFYETLLIASSGTMDTFETDMPKTSNFILFLPRYIAIIGVIMMILFYSSIPKREDESKLTQINIEGFE